MNSLGLRFAAPARRTTAVSRTSSRWNLKWVHTARGLLYPVEDGLGEFLPPQALKTLAVEYQQGLLQRLNDEVRGTPEQSQGIVDTIINTAPHREKTLAFNYASLALNNSFFLDNLKPPPSSPAKNHQSEISGTLSSAIRQQHGTVAQLKSSFSSAATGMFTSGYVWFVTDASGNTGVLPTFGPGTLLIRSRSYMASSKGLILGEDMAQWSRGDPIQKAGTSLDKEDLPRQHATSQPSPPGVSPSSPLNGVSGSATAETPGNSRSVHSSARSGVKFDHLPMSVWGDSPSDIERSVPQTKVDMLNIGEVLYPLFCVSTYEHTWMSAGYGVWGKEEWLKNFWTVLDWKKVSEAYESATRAARKQ
ncbi:hypothetical protein BDN72DRAFT_833389 [Pluteus cervinus]|uniref:Uncharacterized protein n=1 Tax=Pluteus cervinus TaxID=181527 RepID=A0ACD3B9S7_9AGAR|nr:hypothetical protein BDN72DRAFT_833389 [Pluteus cervinus]